MSVNDDYYYSDKYFDEESTPFDKQDCATDDIDSTHPLDEEAFEKKYIKRSFARKSHSEQYSYIIRK